MYMQHFGKSLSSVIVMISRTTGQLWIPSLEFHGSLQDFRALISYSISIMENAFLRHDNEFVLKLDLKNNSCKSSCLLSPSVSSLKPFI